MKNCFQMYSVDKACFSPSKFDFLGPYITVSVQGVSNISISWETNNFCFTSPSQSIKIISNYFVFFYAFCPLYYINPWWFSFLIFKNSKEKKMFCKCAWFLHYRKTSFYDDIFFMVIQCNIHSVIISPSFFIGIVFWVTEERKKIFFFNPQPTKLRSSTCIKASVNNVISFWRFIHYKFKSFTCLNIFNNFFIKCILHIFMSI